MIKYEKHKNDKYTSRTFIVKDEMSGLTVFQVLKKYGTSLSLIRSLKHYENGILLDGIEVKTVEIVKPGQIIEIRIPHDKKTAIVSDLECEIAYEDECVIVFNKPWNMPIHPVKEYRTNTLANAFANHMNKKGKQMAFRPINRLDKDTSGLAVAALDRFSAAVLSGKIDKTYIAICSGQTQKCGSIELPLGRKEGFGIRQVVCENGAYALTHYETLMTNGLYSVVKVKIDTGRLHQIRAHFAHIGHSLLGDELYDGDTTLIDRQALHCIEVSFNHPINNEIVTVKCDLPSDMEKLLSHIFKTKQITT